jgi:hypothetical protein
MAKQADKEAAPDAQLNEAEKTAMKDHEGKCGAKMGEGKCGGGAWQKRYRSNSHRAANDDGSTKSRQSAGSRSRKHTSPLLG